VHDRATQLEMCVRDRELCPKAKHVFFANIQSAHETDLAIYNQNFAMVSQVDERHAPRPDGVHEPGTSDAIPPKPTLYRATEIPTPDTVHQNTNFHAAFVCVDKDFSELLANPVCAENIGAENDRRFCMPDGLNHNRIGIISIMKNLYGVPAHQRSFCEAAQHFCEWCQISFHDLPVFGEKLPPFPGMMVNHFAGPAMNAIDAKHQVQGGTQKGSDPTDTNPRRTGGCIAFMAEGMKRNHDGKCPSQAYQNEIQNSPVAHKTPCQAEAVPFPRR